MRPQADAGAEALICSAVPASIVQYLRPYQQDGVKFMWRCACCILLLATGGALLAAMQIVHSLASMSGPFLSSPAGVCHAGSTALVAVVSLQTIWCAPPSAVDHLQQKSHSQNMALVKSGPHIWQRTALSGLSLSAAIPQGLGKTVQTIAFLSALLGKCGSGGGPHPDPGRDSTIKCVAAAAMRSTDVRVGSLNLSARDSWILCVFACARTCQPVCLPCICVFAMHHSKQVEFSAVQQGGHAHPQPMRADARPDRVPQIGHEQLAARVLHLGCALLLPWLRSLAARKGSQLQACALRCVCTLTPAPLVQPCHCQFRCMMGTLWLCCRLVQGGQVPWPFQRRCPAGCQAWRV